MLFEAFGLIELAFGIVFFLLLVGATAVDRSYHQESPKWWIFSVGLIAIAVWFWPHFTVFGPADVAAVVEAGKEVTPAQHRVVLWDVVRTWSFWAPLGAYLAFGFVYSGLEFFLDVRRSARQYASDWRRFLTNKFDEALYEVDSKGVRQRLRDEFGINRVRTVVYQAALNAAKEPNATPEQIEIAKRISKEFIESYRFKDRIVQLEVGEDGVTPSPRVNRLELAEHIGAWTLFWPPYLVSLIIGDLLIEIFRVIADFFVHLSGRFVRMSFADVFKF